MLQRWEPATARVERLVRYAKDQSSSTGGTGDEDACAPCSTNEKIDLRLTSFAAWPDHATR